MMYPATVFVTAGPAAGTSCTVEKDKFSLGRVKTGNALALKDSSVSAKHLQLSWQDGHWYACDMGSSNGTKLNGVTCEEGESYQLHNGDQLSLGPVTAILVTFEEGPAQDATLEQKLLGDADAFAALVQAYADTLCAQINSDWQQQKQRLMDLVSPHQPPPPPAAAAAAGEEGTAC